jgi:hypothetical protein
MHNPAITLNGKPIGPEYKVGDTVTIEGIHFDHRGQPKFLKKGKYKGDKLKVVLVLNGEPEVRGLL